MRQELVVIGGGVIGLGIAFEALSRDIEAVCFDPAPGAAQSAGPGRIFRAAHAELDAVREAVDARAGWVRWERRATRPFIAANGLAVIGEDAPLYAQAMRAAGAAFRWFASDELSRTVPAAVETGHPLLFDDAAGTIDAEAVIGWLVGELGERLVREPVTDLRAAHEVVEVSSGTLELEARQVVIAAGVDTPDLANKVGIPVAQRTYRHARYELQGGVAAAGWTACFLDRRFATRSRWSHYGVPLGPAHLAVGSAWGEAPFPEHELSQDEVRDRALRELGEWAGTVGVGHIGEVVGVVDCTYPRFDQLVAPFTIRREGAITAVTGEDLFKFAPLVAQRTCEGLTLQR